VFKAGDIRSRGNYRDRTLRYVLERRLVPGLEAAGSGNHRDYSPKQAFLVALACELQEEGAGADIIADLVARVAGGKLWLQRQGDPLIFTYGCAVKIEVCPHAIRTKLGIDEHGHSLAAS